MSSLTTYIYWEDCNCEGIDLENKTQIFEQLREKIEASKLFMDEPLANHTSFKIGGNASILANVVTESDISYVVETAIKEKVPYYIIGNGSNILAPDDGIKGIIIKISEKEPNIKIEEDRVIAPAGILLSKLASVIAENELTGFEFASGIPGTLGGAIFMNAGAYGGEMKQCVRHVKAITKEGKVTTLTNEGCAFDYRSSSIQDEGMIVLEVELKLEKGDKSKILSYTQELNQKRQDKQPLTVPSAGSTFKRPEGYFAGKLIDDAGLRGVSFGGAQVSEKHCGFVVNKGGATAKDVLSLMDVVRKVVKDKFSVDLEPELRLLGSKVER